MRQYLYLLATDQLHGVVPSVLKGLARVCSFMYSAGLRGRTLAYHCGLFKRNELNRPVISVGNLTVGGAGKTPLIFYLANYILRNGLQPAVLIRGYMAGQERQAESDEARMLEKKLAGTPIIVGADRTGNAKKALTNNQIDVFLLDDGFQHWKVKRNLDIVAIDATAPFGNGHLLPRGLLREPPAALKRCDLVIITKADLLPPTDMAELEQKIKVYYSGPVVKAVHQPLRLRDLSSGKAFLLAELQNRKVLPFCSIGNPGGFTQMLKNMGALVSDSKTFMDHHVYTETEIKDLIGMAQEQDISFLLTTEKDAVKLKPFKELLNQGARCLVLEIELQITEGEDEIHNRIHHLLHR